MTCVFITLGSNIDSEANMRLAVRKLAERCTLLAVSPVYETAPVGTVDQPNFLNAAALIETELPANALKWDVLRAIEAELGRVRKPDKNAPRTIDLDVALFGREVLEVNGGHIPDPDIGKHAHVTFPLADLCPFFRHPETGRALKEIRNHLENGGVLRRLEIDLWPDREVSREEI